MTKNEQNQTSRRERLKRQIIAIRDSGETNMFDKNAVARIASDNDFYELVEFIISEPNRYAKFILSGDDNLLPE